MNADTPETSSHGSNEAHRAPPGTSPLDAAGSLQHPEVVETQEVAVVDQRNGSRLFLWFFLGLLFFSLYLLYFLMEPFLDSLILACVFTTISYPFYTRCLRLTKGRRVPAALLAIFSLFFLVVLPICAFVAELVPQASRTISSVNQWLAEGHLTEVLNTYWLPLQEWLKVHLPELDISTIDIRGSLLEASRNTGSLLLRYGTSILSNTVRLLMNVLLILLVMFFLFIDGAELIRRLEYLCPMKPQQTANVIENLRRVSRAVLVGGFCVAGLQGIVGGIGLALVGIPALFWGTVMAFAALVPVVGTGLVWVPAVAYLLIVGKWKAAVFLAVWCVVIVTSIDSFLRPMLMREGARVPVLFIFLSILGGINVFGMLGLLYGPMILGLVAVMLSIYSEEYHSILNSRTMSSLRQECVPPDDK